MADTTVREHSDERSLTDWVSARLIDQAEQLFAQWRGGLSGKPRKSLGGDTPDQTQRHVIPMIEAVGRHVQNPALNPCAGIFEQAANEGVDTLDDLSGLIIRRVGQDVAYSGEEYSTQSVLEVFGRLAEGLRTMTSITRAAYQKSNEDVHHRQLQRLSDFGLLLGHEMRCSLNSILISAEVLARPEFRSDPELCDKQLDGIRSAVTHAEELLRYADAVIGAPATLPELRMAPLQTVLEAVSEELESRARASSVTLIFQKSLPRWSVDSVVARLALCNLLVNAIKYADAAKPNRWVMVRVGPAEGDDPPTLMIEVADNGLGIPPELQQQVFLRSFRAHPQVAQGAGFGLAITRECLAEHGGSIHLISEEGVGTTFRVRLPAVPMDIADPLR